MRIQLFSTKLICGIAMSALIAGGCGTASQSAASNETSAVESAENEQMADSTDGAEKTENTVNTEETEDGQNAYELQTRELFAMDTYMTFSAYGADAEAALDEAEAEIMRLDQLLAAESEDSEIAGLNRNGGGELSEDTAYLIERSLALQEETDGAIEIAVYPIKQAWGFTDEEYRVPSDEELQELLPLADSSLLDLDANAKTIEYQKDGMKIDLGGITKGYASSRLVDIFMKHDVKGMINLGGNVQVYGGKPDGSDWRVAVQAPEISEEDRLPWLSKEASGSAALAGIDYIGILETQDQAVITSGVYERYCEEDGRIYHHIIDPKTGYPSDSGLISVTIVSRDGTLADGLSTSMFVLGLDRAGEIWKEHRDEFDMILMDTDGVLYATEGIEDQFTSDLEINWIR